MSQDLCYSTGAVKDTIRIIRQVVNREETSETGKDRRTSETANDSSSSSGDSESTESKESKTSRSTNMSPISSTGGGPITPELLEAALGTLVSVVSDHSPNSRLVLKDGLSSLIRIAGNFNPLFQQFDNTKKQKKEIDGIYTNIYIYVCVCVDER